MHIDNDIAKQTQRSTNLVNDALILGAIGAGMLAGRWIRSRKKRCTGRCQTAPTPSLIPPTAPTATPPSEAQPSSGVPIAIVDAPATEIAPRSDDAGSVAAKTGETASTPTDAALPRATANDEIEPPHIVVHRSPFAVGRLLKAGMEALAALQPLPAAPTGSGMLAVDVENLVTYQGALAVAAKRDEQIRAIGSLLASIVK